MIRNVSARLATGVVAALLGVMLLSVGGVVAQQPGWKITASADLPATVAPGNAAGYSFTITNTGTSNISQLYLTADYPEVYFQTPVLYQSPTDVTGTDHPCVVLQNSPNLYCSLGALNAGQSFSFEVAFTTPTSGSSFNPGLGFNTTGATTSDGSKGTSHGDTLLVGLSTTLNPSPDFTGGFTLTGGDTFGTSTNLSKRNNPQSSVVTSPILLGVTLTEGSTFPGTGTDPCSTTTLTCVGQWDNLHVGDGTQGPVKLVMTILGSTIPGGVSLSDFQVFHDGVWISTQCNASNPPTNMECLTASKVGNNYQIVVWLKHNGALRGGY